MTGVQTCALPICKSSPAQAAAARANGAKSQGPTTPEGRAKLGGNRMTHGFRAASVSLANENRADYDAHLDEYLKRYAPIDKVETDLVGLCALNMWHLMRMNSIEVSLFDLEMSGLDAEMSRDFKTIDEWGRLALAFKKSAGDNALELLRRYKSSAERAYHRSFQALEQIKKDRATAVPTAVATLEAPKDNSAAETQAPPQPAAQQPVTPTAQPAKPALCPRPINASATLPLKDAA